jgi:hypothetical protein
MFYYCQSSLFSFAYIIYFDVSVRNTLHRSSKMIIGVRLVELLLSFPFFSSRSVINSNIIIKEEREKKHTKERERGEKKKSRDDDWQ